MPSHFFMSSQEAGLAFQSELATHHPVVEALKHVTSPLSAALAIFAFGRYKNRTALSSFFRANCIILKNKFNKK
jgi:hypothetical protein